MQRPYSYRSDPGVPEFPDDKPIIIFDGHCVLCSRWARFVLWADRRERYRLLAAQTALGAALYRHLELDPEDYETNILLENGVARVKSDGTIAMFEGLGLPWSLVRGLRLLPRAWRDRLYEALARNRLTLFGRREVCMLSLKAHQDRFLS